MRRAAFRAAAAASLVAFVVLPFFVSAYFVSLLYSVFTFCALAASWNIIAGYTGYVSFGHVSFFGIGGYAAALSVLSWKWHWIPAALAGGVLATLLALPIGAAMLRLRGPYFAIGMLGLARVLERAALAWEPVTGGGRGLYLPPVLEIRGVYYAAGLILVSLVLGTLWLENSPLGPRLLAIREDEVAAESLGIPTARLKLAAFAVSAFAPGILGGIYAWHLSYLDPGTAFGLNVELTAIVSAIVGGVGTVWGPLIGGVGMSLVTEALWARFPRLHLALFGGIVVLTMLRLPQGVVAGLIRLRVLPPGRNLLRRAVVEEWAARRLPLGRIAAAPVD